MICPDCNLEVGDVEKCPKCELDLTLFDEDGLKRLERAVSIVEKRKQAAAKLEREQKAAQKEAEKKTKKESFWKGLLGGK